jgi:GNAT superfamily N-acetyltransferase
LLALRPQLKGRGLGRVLMNRAEDYLAAAGCEVADLRTISARYDLVPMYKHLGYLETGTAAMPPEIPLKIPCHFITMSKPLQLPEHEKTIAGEKC